MGSSSDDFSVLVLPSDLGVDARPFLTNQESEIEEQENWHDCSQFLSSDEDFCDLELLHFFRLQGFDKFGNRIIRIVGKYFPAPVVTAERLKRYIAHKLCSELLEGPFSIVYMHSTVQKEDNSPGITILRWIYEDLPSDFKDRLQVVYFIHPGLWSRLVFATLGRFFLSGGEKLYMVFPMLGLKLFVQIMSDLYIHTERFSFSTRWHNILYWKINYVSRLQYLWDDIKKEDIEIPDFVKSHDEILEHRPLTDYGIEPDPFHLAKVPSTAYSFGRYDQRWSRQDLS